MVATRCLGAIASSCDWIERPVVGMRFALYMQQSKLEKEEKRDSWRDIEPFGTISFRSMNRAARGVEASFVDWAQESKAEGEVDSRSA